jgi:hypothetical protein
LVKIYEIILLYDIPDTLRQAVLLIDDKKRFWNQKLSSG